MEAKDKKISQLETTTDYINSYVPTVTNGINKKLHIGDTFTTVVQPIQTTLNSVQTKLEQKYDSTISRTAKTVLAAPANSEGQATFRTLVGTDLPTVTTSTQGAMTAADKVKLDNFEGPIPESDINALFE